MEMTFRSCCLIAGSDETWLPERSAGLEEMLYYKCSVWLVLAPSGKMSGGVNSSKREIQNYLGIFPKLFQRLGIAAGTFTELSLRVR